MEAAVQVQNDLGEEWDRQTILYLPYLMPQDTRILVQKSFRPVSLVCLRASFCLYRIYRVSARTCRRTKSGSLKSDIHLDQGKNIRKPHGAWCRNCFQEPFSLNTAAFFFIKQFDMSLSFLQIFTQPLILHFRHPDHAAPQNEAVGCHLEHMDLSWSGWTRDFWWFLHLFKTVDMQSFGSNFGSSSAIASRIGHLSSSNTTLVSNY